jgi:myosin-1
MGVPVMHFLFLTSTIFSIQYSVKKTTWQSGGTCEIKFVADTAVKAAQYMNSGKVTTVRVAPGLPSSSRPNAAAHQPKLASVNPKASRQAYVPPAASQAYVQPQRVVTPPSNNAYAPPQAPSFTPPLGRGTLSTNSLNANQVLSQSNPGLNAVAAAAAKKRPPPPPPAKKLPMVRALYVSHSLVIFFEFFSDCVL